MDKHNGSNTGAGSNDVEQALRELKRKRAKEKNRSSESIKSLSGTESANNVRTNKPVNDSPINAGSSGIMFRRDLPRREISRKYVERVSAAKVTLEEIVVGTEQSHPTCGPAFIITTRVADIPGASELDGAFLEKMPPLSQSLRERIIAACSRKPPQDLPPIDSLDLTTPENIVFMDIESTGLRTSALFLIGAMVWENGGFVVKQYLARNYAEEAAVISFFIDEFAGKGLLVTFNGKSFDLPFIRARSISNRIPFKSVIHHFDLLHECRRVWKKALPDCKLQTLELYVCRRGRHGDIPGAEIPDAYHRYVRTGDAFQIVEILKHNMLDLVTLADIMTRFPE